MQRGIRPFVILTAFALGCVATSTVVSSTQASSNETPQSGSTTCRYWHILPTRVLDAALPGGAKGTVTLPPGWEPVGGGDLEGSAGSTVVACQQN